MTPHEYATEVMGVISDGTVQIGMWSERDRDTILHALMDNYRAPYVAGLDLVVSPGLLLAQVGGDTRRVRLVDVRTKHGCVECDRISVAAVNDKLAAVGGQS